MATSRFRSATHLDVVGSFALMQAHVPLPAPWNLTPQPYDGKIYRDLPVNNVSQRNLAAWTRYKFTGTGLEGLRGRPGGELSREARHHRQQQHDFLWLRPGPHAGRCGDQLPDQALQIPGEHR
jgi:hypothetical protein